MSLFCTVNSRIGWSDAYVGHGVGPVLGLLVVCFLILVGIVAVAVGKEEGCHGSHFAGIGIWMVAALLLQGLPHTATGIQFIPLPPWSYTAWIPRIISAASWLSFLVGLHPAYYKPEKVLWKDAVAATFVALGLNVLLSFADTTDAAAPIAERSSVIASCHEKIARWEMLLKERSSTLEKLSADKEALVARVRSLGCRTKHELMANSVGCTLAHELEQLTRQIAQTQTETKTIEATVERAQSALRCIEREALLKEHGMSNEELARASQIDHELQDKLPGPTPGSEVQMDKLLDDVLPK